MTGKKKKLYRSRTDVKISGVCGGIAEYLGIDSTIVRVLWVLGSFMTALMFGLLLYVICVFIIPEDSGFIDAEFREK